MPDPWEGLGWGRVSGQAAILTGMSVRDLGFRRWLRLGHEFGGGDNPGLLRLVDDDIFASTAGAAEVPHDIPEARPVPVGCETQADFVVASPAS